MGLPFLLVFRVFKTLSSVTVGASKLPGGGGGGGGGLTVTGLGECPLRPPLDDTWIGEPDADVPTVRPVNVATPFFACSVAVKPGSLGSVIVMLPSNAVSTL